MSHPHTPAPHAQAPHGSLRDYLTGFALSVVLTVIPFGLVMAKPLAASLSTPVLVLVLMGFAVAQMLVHVVYFLHLTPRTEGGWNLLALIFTLVLVTIGMSGSVWVMYHLSANMMPLHDMSSIDTTGEAFLPAQSLPQPLPQEVK